MASTSRMIALALYVLATSCGAQGLVGSWRGPGIDLELRADTSYTWRTAARTLEGKVLVQGSVIRFMVPPDVAPTGFIDYRFMGNAQALRLGDSWGNIFDFVRCCIFDLCSLRGADLTPAEPSNAWSLSAITLLVLEPSRSCPKTTSSTEPWFAELSRW